MVLVNLDYLMQACLFEEEEARFAAMAELIVALIPNYSN